MEGTFVRSRGRMGQAGACTRQSWRGNRQGHRETKRCRKGGRGEKVWHPNFPRGKFHRIEKCKASHSTNALFVANCNLIRNVIGMGKSISLSASQ